MQEITSITSRPKQRMNLVLENKETVDFLLYYLPRQMGWFYDFTYKEIKQKRARVVLTPNALRAFKKIIPFGIAFVADSYVEPFDIDDFSSGRIKMQILNSDEVQRVEEEVFNL
jgi:hypothetical protein